MRTILFWLHLTAGLVAGLIILSMSVTGLMLAFEPQIVEYAEGHLHAVTPPGPDAPRLEAAALVARAREIITDASPASVTVRSLPTESASVSFGREGGGTLFFNPYTGDLIGKGSQTHAFLHQIQDFHRWFWSRDVGRPFTGAANLMFAGLVVTGFYLWWPRQWTPGAFKAVTRFTPGLQGKARQWNRHNAIGFWSAPFLLIITLTGAVMSYPWANNLLYTLTGTEAPPPPQQNNAPRPGGMGAGGQRPAGPVQPERLNEMVALAEALVPGWVSITVRFQNKPDAPVVTTIAEGVEPPPIPRSQLTLHPATLDVVKWEPFDGLNAGRKARMWVTPLHTGEGFGLPGQIVAFVATAGAVVLVWTGWAMAWRRLFQRKPVPATSPAMATESQRTMS